MKRVFLSILCLILMWNFSYAAAPLKTTNDKSAPGFVLLDLEHKEVSFSDFRGKPIILFFWTTWCPYCRQELRELNDMQKKISLTDTQVLAINIEEPAERVQRFLDNRQMLYKVLLDKDATVASSYGILGVPTFIYINRAGNIVSYSNYFSQDKYEDIASK